MSIFESFTRKVTDTARVGVRKAGEVVEITKLNISINAEEERILKVYAEMGKYVYDLYRNGKLVDENLKAMCGMIDSSRESIQEMRKRILDIKGMKLCPACGNELELDMVYCPQCGKKQETDAPKSCPECKEEDGEGGKEEEN